MYKLQVYKKLVAVFLLGIFTLAITPKKTLHTLLANHTDKKGRPTDSTKSQLTTAGFNCKCDDLVAECQFLAGKSIHITRPLHYLLSSYTFENTYISHSHFFFQLRGPPAQFLLHHVSMLSPQTA